MFPKNSGFQIRKKLPEDDSEEGGGWRQKEPNYTMIGRGGQ